MDNGNKIIDNFVKTTKKFWQVSKNIMVSSSSREKGVAIAEDIPMRIQQNMLKGHEQCSASEPIYEESAPARDENAKNDFLDITALIRSIQRTEGNPDCFLKGDEDCDRLDCAWRLYCLGRDKTSGKSEP
jgi:hypothetical protein